MNLFIVSGASLIFSPTIRHHFWYQVYFLYVVRYLSKVLHVVSSLIGIKIVMDRFIYLKKKRITMPVLIKNCEKYGNNIKAHILIFFAFSSIYNIPNLVIFIITKKGNETNLVSFSNTTEYGIGVRKSIENFKIIFHTLQCMITITSLLLMITISTLTHKIINKNYKDYLKDSNELRKQIRMSIRKIENRESKDQQEHQNSSNYSANEGEEDDDEEEEGEVQVSHKLKRIGEKTSMLVLWVSVLFIINELVAAMGAIMYIIDLPIRYKNLTYIRIGIAILTIYVTTCTPNIFLYKKYNKTFALKFEKLIFCKQILYRMS